jgi:hypothetical protein
MPPVSLSRHIGLNYHVEEAKSWLKLAMLGEATTALAYAAFEIRLAIERILIQYLAAAAPNGQPKLAILASAKKIENRIYQLEGHQKEIDAKFRFMEIVFELLGVPRTLAHPKLGELSAWWHQCSELCHASWTLLALNLAQAERRSIYDELMRIADSLSAQVAQVVSWPHIADAGFAELRDRYARSEATDEDVRAFLRQRGLWARIERPDGSAEFVGNAVAPPEPSDPVA